MTKDSSSRGAKRRGDLNSDSVILSNAKDLFVHSRLFTTLEKRHKGRRSSE